MHRFLTFHRFFPFSCEKDIEVKIRKSRLKPAEPRSNNPQSEGKGLATLGWSSTSHSLDGARTLSAPVPKWSGFCGVDLRRNPTPACGFPSTTTSRGSIALKSRINRAQIAASLSRCLKLDASRYTYSRRALDCAYPFSHRARCTKTTLLQTW